MKIDWPTIISKLPSDATEILQNTEPLRDNILVLVAPDTTTEKKTASGIYLPTDLDKENPCSYGQVYAIGRGAVRDDGSQLPVTGIKVGDTIIFSRYAGRLLYQSPSGTSVKLVPEQDITGKLMENASQT